VLRDRRGGLAVEGGRLERLDGEIAARRASLDEAIGRWKAQSEAVLRIRSLRTAAAAQRDESASSELEGALEELARAQGDAPLVRIEVDPEVVAEVVADWTGVPAGRMVQGDAAQVMSLEETLRARIKGQDHALEIVGRALRGARIGLKDPGKPQVFLLAGPSGVGKTELGLTVADALFGGERFTVSINMSEYQDREMGVSGLIGAKPGYVGYGKGGTLTEAVRQRPYCVVLLDEIEKACTEARNLFYQVFDKGELVDGTGRRIDFKNTVVFMTTNLTGELIQGMCAGGRPDPEAVLAAIRPLLSAALQPAWLARTTVVPFFCLERRALEEIARIKVRRIADRVREAHGVELEVGGDVVARLAERCAEVETGARNVDFLLQSSLLPLVSSEIVSRLAEGGPLRSMGVRVDAEGRFAIRA
jgi:type VI secretion system protein VasG